MDFKVENLYSVALIPSSVYTVLGAKIIKKRLICWPESDRRPLWSWDTNLKSQLDIGNHENLHSMQKDFKNRM